MFKVFSVADQQANTKDPTQPKSEKKFDPAQPNPWVNPTYNATQPTKK